MLLESKSYDIILITETWLNSKFSDKFFCNDIYDIMRADRKSRGGGVAIIYANYMFLTKHKKTKINCIDVITIDIENVNISDKIRIITVYCPPKISSNVFVIDELCILLSNLCS